MNQSADPLPPFPEGSDPSNSQETPEVPESLETTETPETSKLPPQGATGDDGPILPIFELETPRPTTGSTTLPPGVTVGTKPSGSAAFHHTFEEPEEELPVWPEILAIVCMAVGVVGIFMALWQVAGNTLMLTGTWDRKDAPSDWVLLFHIFFNAIGFVLAALLTFGGLAMRVQWPSCVYWLRIWAGLKILLVLVTTIFTWLFLIVPLYHVFHGDKPETDHAHFYTLLSFAWSCLAMVWGWLLPVFLLIWLQRRPVRELVATWSD